MSLTFLLTCGGRNSWSLPEVNDCLKEAGFSSVHFWMREMPNTRQVTLSEDSFNIKYEEMTSFEQRDSWNAYVVGVAPPPKVGSACAD